MQTRGGYWQADWCRFQGKNRENRPQKKKLQSLLPLFDTAHEVLLSRILSGPGFRPMCVMPIPTPPRPEVQLLLDLASQSPADIQGKGYADASPVETSGPNPTDSIVNRGENVKGSFDAKTGDLMKKYKHLPLINRQV